MRNSSRLSNAWKASSSLHRISNRVRTEGVLRHGSKSFFISTAFSNRFARRSDGRWLQGDKKPERRFGCQPNHPIPAFRLHAPQEKGDFRLFLKSDRVTGYCCFAKGTSTQVLHVGHLAFAGCLLKSVIRDFRCRPS